MRIIAGKFRGKRLFSPEGEGTRPTSDKVRESVFGILASRGEIGGRVLDLFAGTGALGLEALSRGADTAIFVDKSPAAAKIIRKNIALTADAEVYNTDWKVAVRKLTGRFDLIFLDPPYALGAETDVVAAIDERDLLAEGGVIVVEHDARNDFATAESFAADRRTYRGTSVTFLRRREEI